MNTTADTQNSTHPDFPLGAYLLGALGVLSGDWLSMQLYGIIVEPTGESHSGILALLCAALALLLGWLLWHLHHRFARNRTTGQAVAYYACAFGLVASAGWMAVASEHWLLHARPFAKSPWFFALVAALLLAGSWLWHSRLGEKVEPVEDIEKMITISPELAANCRALILFVSTPNLVPDVKGYTHQNDPHLLEPVRTPPTPSLPPPESPRVVVQDNGKEFHLAGVASTLISDIEAITAAKIFWNWQQLLRALRGMSELEAVYLLGSPDSPSYKPEPLNRQGRRPEFQPGFKQKPGSGKGSRDYLPLCLAFLTPYLPPRTIDRTPVIIPWAKPVDFEDFNALTKELREIKASLRPQGFDPSEVLVDVTGGQKVTSIAGAVLTINNELRFQYVQTNAPFDSVPYDLVRRATPNLEPHLDG